MKGIWIGYYKHESKRIPVNRRNQKTKFTIEIQDIEENKFTGTVIDDIDSGGMDGIGFIRGTIKNNKITFIKEMPIESLLLKDGEKLKTKKKHPKIYYTGIFNPVNNEIKGVWRFKWGLTKVKGKIAITLPIKGNWEMRKQ